MSLFMLQYISPVELPLFLCPGGKRLGKIQFYKIKTLRTNKVCVRKGRKLNIWGTEVENPETSVVVQWLRLCTPDAGVVVPVPGQATRPHIPQLTPSTDKSVFF